MQYYAVLWFPDRNLWLLRSANCKQSERNSAQHSICEYHTGVTVYCIYRIQHFSGRLGVGVGRAAACRVPTHVATTASSYLMGPCKHVNVCSLLPLPGALSASIRPPTQLRFIISIELRSSEQSYRRCSLRISNSVERRTDTSSLNLEEPYLIYVACFIRKRHLIH